MPINKEEFETGNLHSEIENEITSFLKERKDSGFTSQEIMGGLHYHTDFSTPEVAKISTFVLTDFTNLLYDLVRLGKIRMKVVRDRMYFMASGDSAKCPKCKTEIASPRKTWRMTGRQDKMGKRLELHIGLYDCPKHGAFRAVLGKRKI